MVGVAGFEPATPASRTQCSTRLSHTPTWRAAYRGGPAVPQAAKKPSRKRSSKQRCIRPTPALSPPPRRARKGLAVPAGEWCNGNTAVFGTVILGSSPSSPATSPFHVRSRLRARQRRFQRHRPSSERRVARRAPGAARLFESIGWTARGEVLRSMGRYYLISGLPNRCRAETFARTASAANWRSPWGKPRFKGFFWFIPRRLFCCCSQNWFGL